MGEHSHTVIASCVQEKVVVEEEEESEKELVEKMEEEKPMEEVKEAEKLTCLGQRAGHARVQCTNALVNFQQQSILFSSQ